MRKFDLLRLWVDDEDAPPVDLETIALEDEKRWLKTCAEVLAYPD